MEKFWGWLWKGSQPIIVIILVGGLIFSVLQLRASKRDSEYRYLAGVWNEIMKTSIKYPEFNDKSKTLSYATEFSGDKLIEYNLYARWVLGFIEDLYYNEYQKNDSYYEPWIKTVLEVHKTWLVDHSHYYKNAMPKFCKKIEDLRNEE